MQDATNGSRRHQIIKAFYRGATVRKYIDAVEKGMLPPKFTILDAMIMMILTGAWNRVTAETDRHSRKLALAVKRSKVLFVTLMTHSVF